MIDFVQISKRGKTLDIHFRPRESLNVPLGVSFTSTGITIKAEITMPELSELELSKGASGTVTGFTSDKLVLFLSSGGSADVDGVINDLVLRLSSGGSVDVDGVINDLTIRSSRGGSADLSNSRVHDAVVDISGGSRVTINLDGRLDADVSGGSTLFYMGEPTLGEIYTSGASRVRKI